MSTQSIISEAHKEQFDLVVARTEEFLYNALADGHMEVKDIRKLIELYRNNIQEVRL